ncbi:hypothetical protein [Actinokineospora xionganensis]|uniref:Uncharacterized protein n=1 Tax=Actinokineospora xionganensis TaxID=2684470 RepID=A0ABR7L0Y3_9PSEU|nr:hypothetical protein [Actinokineospora xionganensis]MBC6446310.1 hypothetical protein [Actinokineospora xionganensis]
MIDETDPAVRAARAAFQQIRADLGDRLDASRVAYQAKLAAHEKYVAERAAKEEAQRAEQAPPRQERKKAVPRDRKGKPPVQEKPVRAVPPKQARPEPVDPSDTGVFSVSWMTKN